MCRRFGLLKKLLKRPRKFHLVFLQKIVYFSSVSIRKFCQGWSILWNLVWGLPNCLLEAEIMFSSAIIVRRGRANEFNVGLTLINHDGITINRLVIDLFEYLWFNCFRCTDSKDSTARSDLMSNLVLGSYHASGLVSKPFGLINYCN